MQNKHTRKCANCKNILVFLAFI